MTTPADGPRYRTISEEQFDAEFQPETNPDGSLYRQRDWTAAEDLAAIEQARAERRLWTMVDSDQGPVLAQGYHLVNRLYYVICAIPYAADDEINVEPDLLDDVLDDAFTDEEDET